jgi:hypothetical protein
MDINEILGKNNLVPDLDERTLTEMGSTVVQEYDIDKRSMKDWLDRNKMAMDLIDQKPEEVSEPWPGAANTKLPLALNAAMKVSAEEYAEILRGKEFVKYELYGKATEGKKERAQRVAKRMNFQYQHELEDWEEDHDKLILSKNILGTVHKKYMFSPEKGRPECVLRRAGIVINDNVEHIDEAPRVTDELDVFWWQAEEKFRSQEWQEIPLSSSESEEFSKKDKLNRFLEQLRREDLDEDGYPEPYIVTVHEKTKKVVRIAPNFTEESVITDDQGGVVRIDTVRSRIKYVKYDMIPSYEGGYWGHGFGILLGPLNENCNKLVNDLLNAGTLANQGGGFISANVRMQQGEIEVSPGDWLPVNHAGGTLRDSMVPFPFKEPSSTLYSLLGLLMEVLRELSSVTEVMSGEQPHANMSATSILTLVEQGKKTFNSIYKRHYRSLRKEFLALYDLNFLYEDPKRYVEFHDLEEMMQDRPDLIMPLVHGDYDREGLDVIPTANPEFSSRLQRMAQAESLLQLAGEPEANRPYLFRMFVEGVTDDSEVAAVVIPEEPIKTPQQIAQEMELYKQQVLDTAEVKLKELEVQLKEMEVVLEEMKMRAAGIELPLKVEAQMHKTDQAEANADKARNEKAA